MKDAEYYRWMLRKLIITADYDGYTYMLKDLKEDLDICTEEHYQAFYSDHGSRLIYGWLVCLFGEYGTAPRVGWIQDTVGCSDFIAELLALKEGDPDDSSC